MTSSPDPCVNGGNHHYVYIVECCDGSYYTGYTTDIDRRIEEHNEGEGAKYTRGRRPVQLVYAEAFNTSSEALQREHAIKQLRRSRKERLVENGEEPTQK